MSASLILFPAFIAYLKIPYVAGAWENCSKVLFGRVLKSTEMSEVKQWLMSIGMAVDKTRNMEYSGTCKNKNNFHEKKYYKIMTIK